MVQQQRSPVTEADGPHLALVPTSVSSVTERGRLKDTPANRALRPETTPQPLFEDSRLVDESVYADEHCVLLQGDVKERLRLLIDIGLRVDCIVTSPPYYGQRDYGLKGQLGLEDHPSAFIDNLVEVFGLCREVLRETGSLWINIGDTYWSGKGAHKSQEVKQGARRFGIRPQDRPGDGLWARPKQLLLIPHRLAITLQDSGWLIRNDNVWVKPNPVPDQVRDRCSVSHEYVFHLTNSRYYYFNRLPVGREMPSGSVLPPLDTWEVETSNGSGGGHKASFSEELVRIPILASTPPGGIVLDPFNGSGTSTIFARAHGFRSIGIDLSREYCEHAAEALGHLDAAFATESVEDHDELSEPGDD
ncbi:MAG: site-specific DNA-methyltransferase [Acidimicrobiaceae bacterium]|nr:site-specific DNA-methyltransferase [Acidimicrobiaceae bacterium]MXZ64830.1 site-specific DNA-methyltransferase [Acidimicrobiaceae bacterium]MYF32285.1 site-specific DNA-methyltransferase [Acidimicrobiaceae bacterium]MYG77741.1 site-specific DNA-methyltransferase [Acidimicrobiaceae bacterium]MYJ84055.1 site-specific DNA-methyltransferase [Acidimicrobiaceae bacterium]